MAKANISIRPFTATTTNALNVFKKKPFHKRAWKKAKKLFGRKPKSIKKSAKELGRSVTHAVKEAHPAVKVGLAVGTVAAVGYPTVKYAQKKTGQLGLEGRMVWARPAAAGQPDIKGEIVSYKRSTGPLGRTCIVICDDDGQTYAFSEEEVKLRNRDGEDFESSSEISKKELRRHARKAMPLGEERHRVANARQDRKVLKDLKPVFSTNAGEGKVGPGERLVTTG